MENLRALVYGAKINTMQKALAQKAFRELEAENKRLKRFKEEVRHFEIDFNNSVKVVGIKIANNEPKIFGMMNKRNNYVDTKECEITEIVNNEGGLKEDPYKDCDATEADIY